MRFVVIGGNGFIGKNIARMMNSNTNEVIIIDKTCKNALTNGIQYMCGDISCLSEISSFITQGDCIIDLAWSNVPVSSGTQIGDDVKNNVADNARLFELCVTKRVDRIVFMSSGGTVYGKPQYLPINEEHPNNPNSIYGLNKLFVEKLLTMITRNTSTKGISIRMSNPYGMWQRPFTGQGIIPTFLASAILDKPVEVWGDGHSVRDYVYISDAVKGIMALCKYEGEHSVFNIGSNKGASIIDIIDTIQRIIQKELRVIHKTESKVEVNQNILDCALMNQEAGWQATTSLTDGITMMLHTWNSVNQTFSKGVDL